MAEEKLAQDADRVKPTKAVRDARALSFEAFRLPGDGRKWKVLAKERRALYMELATYADGDGTNACPSIESLQRAAGSRRSTFRRLDELAQLGFVSNHGKSRFQGTVYRSIFIPSGIIPNKPPIPPDSPMVPDSKPQESEAPSNQKLAPIVSDSFPMVPDSTDSPDSNAPMVPDRTPMVPDRASNSATYGGTRPSFLPSIHTVLKGEGEKHNSNGFFPVDRNSKSESEPTCPDCDGFLHDGFQHRCPNDLRYINEQIDSHNRTLKENASTLRPDRKEAISVELKKLYRKRDDVHRKASAG